MINSPFLRHSITLLMVAAVTSARADSGAAHQVLQSRPIQLGASGGNINDRSTLYCCSGTLGALVKDANGVQYILSNNHVLGRVNQAAPGEPVNQPGMIDQGCLQNGIVASFTRLVPIQFGKGRNLPPNDVDAAMAQVVSGAVRTDGAILDIGTVSASTVSATVGQAVQKSGRTTGHTSGTVAATDMTVNVGYSSTCGGAANQVARFVNQIRIDSATFSTGGDSGSVIFETGSTPRAVGLLFAGSPSSTIANPIDRVLALLNVSMVGGSAPPPTYGALAGVVTDAQTGDPLPDATVSVDSGQSGISGIDGSYSIENVPTGERTVTAAADGFTPQTTTVNVNENQTTAVDFTLQAVAAGSQAIVQCVTYNTQGGKNRDKDMLITITVVDDSGSAVAGAQVDIAVTLNGGNFGTGTGAISSSSGQVTYTVRNAGSGTYETTVTAVSVAGLSFEGSTPVNSFTKGTEPVPDTSCREDSTGGIAGGGPSHVKAAIDRARAIKGRHGDALMEIEDVVGHGLSRDDNGQPVIEIYLSKENANARAKIPGSLENVPVRVVVTGPFTAY